MVAPVAGSRATRLRRSTPFTFLNVPPTMSWPASLTASALTALSSTGWKLVLRAPVVRS
jgi:hypothetical protein